MSSGRISIAAMSHQNAKAGEHFFSPNTMEFFASKVESDGYVSHDQRKALFVTSEQFKDRDFQYTVRVFDLATGKVDTVGKFQMYASKATALAAAAAAAHGNMIVTAVNS